MTVCGLADGVSVSGSYAGGSIHGLWHVNTVPCTALIDLVCGYVWVGTGSCDSSCGVIGSPQCRGCPATSMSTDLGSGNDGGHVFFLCCAGKQLASVDSLITVLIRLRVLSFLSCRPCPPVHLSVFLGVPSPKRGSPRGSHALRSLTCVQQRRSSNVQRPAA